MRSSKKNVSLDIKKWTINEAREDYNRSLNPYDPGDVICNNCEFCYEDMGLFLPIACRVRYEDIFFRRFVAKRCKYFTNKNDV